MTSTATNQAQNHVTYETVNVVVGSSGTMVHAGTKENGELLPFPQCGTYAHRIVVETEAAMTCHKCIARTATCLYCNKPATHVDLFDHGCCNECNDKQTAAAAVIKTVVTKGNWTTGTLTFYGQVFKFQAKVYDEPSHYGINEGRISKLWIATTSGTVVYDYDRGLDVNNLTVDVRVIVNAIEAL